MNARKGIILAGGTGSRLFPGTLAVSKQLIPVFDKPMIYYPLSVLMLSGIREVCVITTKQDQSQFQRLLGDGSHWGMNIEFIIQNEPEGIAQAYLLAEDYTEQSPTSLILGDNIFYGNDLVGLFKNLSDTDEGGYIFGYQVADPSRYGVVSYDKDHNVTKIVEKPAVPESQFAITGLYCLDKTAAEKARQIKKSERGEYEIISLLNMYLQDKQLDLKLMGRGFSWFDTGTHESLIDAGNFVRTIQNRQGLQIGCPEETALKNRWITPSELETLAKKYPNAYGDYLVSLAQENS